MAIEPRREQLEALARRYHHLQVEHQSFEEGGAIRLRIEDELLAVRERLGLSSNKFNAVDVPISTS